MTQILLPKGALAASILHFPGLVITFTIAIPTSWQIITYMSEDPPNGSNMLRTLPMGTRIGVTRKKDI